MKKLLAAIAAGLLSTGIAAADAPKGPVAVTKSAPAAKQGAVTFDHGGAGHKAQPCAACHESAKGGKIAGLDMKLGHATCQKCHAETAKADASRKALQACTSCHAKK